MTDFPLPPWRQNGPKQANATAQRQGGGGQRRQQQDHSVSLCPPPPPAYQYHSNTSFSNHHQAGITTRRSYPAQPPRRVPSGPFASPSSALMPSQLQNAEQNLTQALSGTTAASTTQYSCAACQLSLETEASLRAHIQSHITCTECSFTASRKLVKAHFQSVHGKFSGRGFKSVTIAVPGCRIQRFRICVGNHPEDLKMWIQERKRRFPRQSRPTTTSKSVIKEGLDSLLDGYGSSSCDESEDKRKECLKTGSEHSKFVETSSSRHANYRSRLCRYFMRNGTCRNGDACNFSHELAESGRSHRAHNASLPRHRKKKSSSSMTLLRKLLESDARRERALTLQLFRYLVDCNYLQEQRPNPSASSSA